MLAIVLCFVLTIFAARLVDLQLLNRSGRATQAKIDRTAEVSLPAQRGTLFDSAMKPLAESVAAVDVTADPRYVTDKDATADYLAPILNIPKADIVDSLTTDKHYAVVAKQVSPDVWDAVASLDLVGIFGQRTIKRTYPSGDLAANILGYLRPDGAPGAGLEFGLDKELRGVDGVKIFESGLGGRQIPTGSERERDPVAGTSVQLTIDRDLQWVAQKALADQVRDSAADSGAVVVMDVRTGEIKALASVPTFDPNRPSEYPDEVKNNKALTEVFEPGSTSKVITMAAALNEQAITPRSVFTVPYSFTRGGSTFRNHEGHPTMNLTAAGILAKSANTGTILVSEEIGEQKLYDYMKKFGIGEPTGLQFPGESVGYIPPTEEWSATSFPTIAFGQGLSLNAIQATSVFATVANGGVRMPASLIKSYVGSDGSVQPAQATEGVRVIDEKPAQQLLRMMEQVTGDEGTAMMASIPGYRVGGKTGTAYRYNEEVGGYDNTVTASFIGVAPADDPVLAVGVFVHNPKKTRYGGQTGGPVFKQVMVQGLQTMNVPPSGKKPAVLPIYESDLAAGQ